MKINLQQNRSLKPDPLEILLEHWVRLDVPLGLDQLERLFVTNVQSLHQICDYNRRRTADAHLAVDNHPVVYVLLYEGDPVLNGSLQVLNRLVLGIYQLAALIVPNPARLLPAGVEHRERTAAVWDDCVRIELGGQEEIRDYLVVHLSVRKESANYTIDL